MDPIKEAFSKIKDDITFLKNEIQDIKAQIKELNNLPTQNITPTNQQTDQQTDFSQNTCNFTLETQSSTGNRGVPTNRQTNQQTNKQTHQQTQNQDCANYSVPFQPDYSEPQFQPKDPISQFAKANKILDSLDDIKREIYLKFKALTSQEMLVFSTLYSFEDQNIQEITYKSIAEKLYLSESSIRDYINKLTKKGIPIEKIKKNNKKILLKISPELKNIATLPTICQLRDL